MMNKLKPNDTIRIIASGYGNCPDTLIEKAVNEIKKHGYQVKISPGLINNAIPYHANTDDFRADDLYQAIHDEDSSAIWCLKGGYGSARIIPHIAAKKLPKSHKFFIGFSDITSLHYFFSQNTNFACIHGANATNGVQPDKYDYINYRDVLEILNGSKKDTVIDNIKSLNDLAKKPLKGEIVGGNLMLSANSIGTCWQLNAHGKILLLEDIDEKGYQIDRLLDHLNQSGMLKNVKGVVFGDFRNSVEDDGNDYSEYAMRRFANLVDFPVFKINDIGHLKRNRAFIYNQLCTIEPETSTFKLHF